MDILNVTNEIAQLFTAFGIAAVAGLTFHFVWESFTSEAFPRIWKVTTFAALFALLATGWFIFLISPFFVFFPVVVWWAAFLYYRRQWRTPSRIEFYDLEHVQFVVLAPDAKAADVPVGTFGRSRQDNEKELPR